MGDIVVFIRLKVFLFGDVFVRLIIIIMNMKKGMNKNYLFDLFILMFILILLIKYYINILYYL